MYLCTENKIDMGKSDINILLCTLDEDFKTEICAMLSDYSVSDIRTIHVDNRINYNLVVIDSKTFSEHSSFAPYNDILFYLSDCSVIMLRPGIYNAYPDISKISSNIVITNLENIISVIETIVSTPIGVLKFDNFVIDDYTRKIYYNRNEIAKLTPRYFYIIQELVHNFGELVTSERLMNLLWGMPSYKNKRSLDVMMTYIKSIIRYSETVELITVYAEGYILKNKED